MLVLVGSWAVFSGDTCGILPLLVRRVFGNSLSDVSGGPARREEFLDLGAGLRAELHRLGLLTRPLGVDQVLECWGERSS